VVRPSDRDLDMAACSVAVDLKIRQVVDVPNMLVSAFLLKTSSRVPGIVISSA
jgi:acetamidase/formamidase